MITGIIELVESYPEVLKPQYWPFQLQILVPQLQMRGSRIRRSEISDCNQGFGNCSISFVDADAEMVSMVSVECLPAFLALCSLADQLHTLGTTSASAIW